MFQIEIFQQRLKQLREQSQEYSTQKAFSDYIGITQQSLSGYEKGVSKPPIDVLYAIAEKCNVSLDWLCGLSNVHQTSDNTRTYAHALENIVSLHDHIPFSVQEIENVISSNACEITRVLKFDDVIQTFLGDWKDILSLHSNGKIKRNLYDLWLSDELTKYDFDVNSDADYQAFMGGLLTHPNE